MRRTRRATWLSLAAMLSPAIAHAQRITLIDVNPVVDPRPGAEPNAVRAGTDRLYFSAWDTANGLNLWRSDGTPETTRLVRSLLSGVDSYEIATLGNLAFFSSGSQPWVSDGTAAGTRLIRPIGPGYPGTMPRQFTAAGSLVFFNADDGDGFKLWRTDGTDAGTFRVGEAAADLLGGAGPLFFKQLDPQTGFELWTSDGTIAGTRIVSDVCPGTCSSKPNHLTRIGDTLFFTADDGSHGSELWKLNVTTGVTSMVADLVPGPGAPGIQSMAAVGGVLFLATSEGPALWRSDGTMAGTQLVTSVDARRLTAVGSWIFFVGAQPATGRELWRSDGTAAGTVPVVDACPGPCHTFPDPGAIEAFHLKLLATSELLFFTRPDAAGISLWRSDGTAAGTFELAAETDPNTSALFGTEFAFASHDDATGWELWKTDGSVAGTIPLTARVDNSSHPADPVAAQDRLFFEAFRPDLGRELWLTEGTAATTAAVDLTPGPADSEIASSGAFGRDLLFDLRRGLNGNESSLWRSDGTRAGTTFLHPLRLRFAPVQLGSIALLSGGDLFDAQLWRTDGTPEGTFLVKDTGSEPYSPLVIFLSAQADTQYFTDFGGDTSLWRTDGTTDGTQRIASIYASEAAPLHGQMVLSADDGPTGRELWRTDGWPQGTVPIVDLVPGPLQASNPRALTSVGGRVFFTASTLAYGRELWTTDGTTDGTSIVKDLVPGWPDSISDMRAPMAVLDGVVYFIGYDADFKLQLWRSDGTAPGTTVVRPNSVGAEWFVASFLEEPPLTVAGGRLWFSAYTGANGFELWQSDGTEAGTILFADIAPGPSSSSPRMFRADGRRLYLFADDGIHGREPWAIDLPPSVSVGDVHLVEGDDRALASFAVRLSRPSATEVVVSFSTVDGTAVQGQDYQALSGALTFPAGATAPATVLVALIGDQRHETDETFTLRLERAAPATIADGEGVALIHDDDAPQVELNGVVVAEGDSGTAPAVFQARLTTKDGGPAALATSLSFATVAGTAASGLDFTPASGTLAFGAGTPSGATQPVAVSVLGDTLDEADERFLVRVTPASDVIATRSEASGRIADDDGSASGLPTELQPGGWIRRALRPAPPHWYAMSQRPNSSYEVVIDEVSGDAQPLVLERLAAGGVLVLQSAAPVGTGASVSLRWRNQSTTTVTSEEFRVRSGSCQEDCGIDDTYRVRVYDTTLAGARYTNAGSLRTFLILQNRSAGPAEVSVTFWSESGGFLYTELPSYLLPGQSFVDDTPIFFSDHDGGSVTVSHTAGYGGLSAKLVTIDPATGFSSDTPMTHRPR